MPSGRASRWTAFRARCRTPRCKAFVDRLTALAGDGGLAEALDAAEAMLAEGAAVDAAETFAAILGEEPENAAAYGGLARAHLALGNLDQAEAFLAARPRGDHQAAKDRGGAGAAGAGAAGRQVPGRWPSFAPRLLADPDDHQARFDLALALHAAGKVEGAIEELLELFRRDRDWNDGAAKTQLFTIFEALKPNDPIVLKGRRRLSSMIFA